MKGGGNGGFNPMDTLKGAGVGALLGGGGGAITGGSLMGAKGIMGGQQMNVPASQQKPEWMLTGADGKLRNDLMLNGAQPAAAGQSQDVLNKLQGMATAQGPSQSAQYLMDANNRNTQNALGQADQQARSGLADATGMMAMRGGVDAGSRERLAKSSGFANMMGKQKILNDASGNQMDILSKDEAQKTSMLQALPANLLAQAGFEQDGKRFDISNTLGTLGNKYQNDMSGWAANQAAREQAQLANKKSGMLGLGIAGIL